MTNIVPIIYNNYYASRSSFRNPRNELILVKYMSRGRFVPSYQPPS